MTPVAWCDGIASVDRRRLRLTRVARVHERRRKARRGGWLPPLGFTTGSGPWGVPTLPYVESAALVTIGLSSRAPRGLFVWTKMATDVPKGGAFLIAAAVFIVCAALIGLETFLSAQIWTQEQKLAKLTSHLISDGTVATEEH
jgi:hypothetical protein